MGPATNQCTLNLRVSFLLYTTKVVGRLNQDNIMFLKQYSVVVALLLFHEMVSFCLFDRFY